jgi:hypothetical protein
MTASKARRMRSSSEALHLLHGDRQGVAAGVDLRLAVERAIAPISSRMVPSAARSATGTIAVSDWRSASQVRASALTSRPGSKRASNSSTSRRATNG